MRVVKHYRWIWLYDLMAEDVAKSMYQNCLTDGEIAEICGHEVSPSFVINMRKPELNPAGGVQHIGKVLMVLGLLDLDPRKYLGVDDG